MGLEALFPELRHMKAVAYLASELSASFCGEPVGTVIDPYDLALSIGWPESDVREALGVMEQWGEVRKDGDRWTWIDR